MNEAQAQDDELPQAEAGPSSGLSPRFVLTEPATGILRRYDRDYRLVHRDVPLRLPVDQRGYLRSAVQEHARWLVGADGQWLAGWRLAGLAGDRVIVMPTAWDDLPEADRPLTRMVIDVGNGRPVGEVLGIHGEDGALAGYWRINYLSGEAVWLDAAGREMEGAEYRAGVAGSPDIPVLVNAEGEVVFDRSRWQMPDSAARPLQGQQIDQADAPAPVAEAQAPHAVE
jgi:hypothetical protein